MSQPIISFKDVTLNKKINDGINNYKDHFCGTNFKGLNYSQLQEQKTANNNHNYGHRGRDSGGYNDNRQ